MKFSDIIGNEPLKKRLAGLVKGGRISHAFLFSCKEGYGGLPLAIAFAQFIQCDNPVGVDSCGTCPACIKNNKLVHPDVHFTYPVANIKDIKKPRSIDFIAQWREAILNNCYMGQEDWFQHIGIENKQGIITVEEAAEIIKGLGLKTYESKYKIQIIWLPEKMHMATSNKLLKIIEEPPDNTLFLLISEDPEQLLATILSRTQMVKVAKPDDNEVMHYLANLFSLDLKAARRIAHICDGNISKAVSMARNTGEGQGNEKLFIDWMRLLLKPVENHINISGWVDEFATHGRENQKAFLAFAQETVRECLISNHGDPGLVRFDNEVITNFDRFAPFIHENNAEELMLLFNKAHYAIERNANPKILFLDLSFKISKLLKVSLQVT